MVTGKIFHCFVHPGSQEIGADEAWQGAIPGTPVPETPVSFQKVAEGAPANVLCGMKKANGSRRVDLSHSGLTLSNAHTHTLTHLSHTR